MYIEDDKVGHVRNAYKILVGKPEGKTSLWKPRCRGKDNIKIDLKQTGCEGLDCIHVGRAE